VEFCLLRFTNLVVTGTWTDYEFPETLGNVIIPTDFQSIIFQRGRHTNHQPDMATRDPTIRRKSSLAAAWFGRIATPDFKVFIMIFLFKLDGCWWHSHLDTFLFIPIVYNPMVIQLYMFILVYTIHVCWLDTNCLIHAVKKSPFFSQEEAMQCLSMAIHELMRAKQCALAALAWAKWWWLSVGRVSWQWLNFTHGLFGYL